jgi:transposase
VNFQEWMVFFLENIHKYDNDYSKDLAELLPHNFKTKKGDCTNVLS